MNFDRLNNRLPINQNEQQQGASSSPKTSLPEQRDNRMIHFYIPHELRNLVLTHRSDEKVIEEKLGALNREKASAEARLESALEQSGWREKYLPSFLAQLLGADKHVLDNIKSSRTILARVTPKIDQMNAECNALSSRRQKEILEAITTYDERLASISKLPKLLKMHSIFAEDTYESTIQRLSYTSEFHAQVEFHDLPNGEYITPPQKKIWQTYIPEFDAVDPLRNMCYFEALYELEEALEAGLPHIDVTVDFASSCIPVFDELVKHFEDVYLDMHQVCHEKDFATKVLRSGKSLNQCGEKLEDEIQKICSRINTMVVGSLN